LVSAEEVVEHSMSRSATAGRPSRPQRKKKGTAGDKLKAKEEEYMYVRAVQQLAKCIHNFN